MTPDVIRRHYLEAMGITAWASKFQLPNALPTEACEWEDSAPAPTPPRERLQALLDDAQAPKPKPKQPAEPSQKPQQDAALASPSAVRALLEDKQVSANASQENPPDKDTTEVDAVPSRAKAKPLTFTLSCWCIDGRWLLLKAGDVNTLEQQLLSHLLYAAGIQREALPEVSRFTWPQMVNAFAVEDPLDEAREGLAAFIAGSASRRGWRLERVLWWGPLDAQLEADPAAENAPLARVLNVAEAHSHTLSLPIWQGPALASLLNDENAKRNLWPALQALGKQWADVGSKAQDTADGS